MLKEYIKEDSDMSVLNLVFKDPETELTSPQLEAIKESLLKDKVIWSVEQGLGKTYLAVCLLNALLPQLRREKKKAIICVPQNKLVDFQRHIESKTHAKTITTTGDAKNIERLKKNFSTADCILCTPSAWGSSLEFNCRMFNASYQIGLMIYDEAAGIKDKGYMHFIELSRRFASNVAMANGTPLGSASNFNEGNTEELRTLYNLLYSIDKVSTAYKTFYKNYTDHVRTAANGLEVRRVNTDRIMDTFGECSVNMNRSDLSISTVYDPCNFHRVYTTKQQEIALESVQQNGDLVSGILYRPSVCLNYGIQPLQIAALYKLWQIVNTIPKTNNIIIYARNTDTLMLLKQLFTQSAHRPTVVLDGQHTPKASDKQLAEDTFNSTPGCIALTNIEKGSNLDAASNIIVYDAPADVLQYIFRGIRGAKSKTIQLDWIYYPYYDNNSMINTLLQIKNTMDLLNRENDLYELLKQELLDVYPDNPRLKEV